MIDLLTNPKDLKSSNPCYYFILNNYIGQTIIIINILLDNIVDELTYVATIARVFVVLDKVMLNSGFCDNTRIQIIADIQDMIKDDINNPEYITTIREHISTHNFFEFLLKVIILYIKQILVYKNSEWCAKYYTPFLDIADFKASCKSFMHNFVISYINGLYNQTNILELFNPNYQHGGTVPVISTPQLSLTTSELIKYSDEVELTKMAPRKVGTYEIIIIKEIDENTISEYFKKYIRISFEHYESNVNNKYTEIIIRNGIKHTFDIIPKTLKMDTYNDDTKLIELIAKQKDILYTHFI